MRASNGTCPIVAPIDQQQRGAANLSLSFGSLGAALVLRRRGGPALVWELNPLADRFVAVDRGW